MRNHRMSYHELMRQWIAAGTNVEHARYRLTKLDALIPDTIPCRHRNPIAGCSCFHCALKSTRVTAAFCKDCETIEP